jgi:3-isopropylmalate dehydrogenase
MSVAMLLRHLGLADAARDVERAVESDLSTRGESKRSTSQVGDALVKALG